MGRRFRALRRSLTAALQIYWSTTNELVAIAGEDSFYVLRFDREAYQAHLESGEPIDDEGVEDAFDVVCEIPEV